MKTINIQIQNILQQLGHSQPHLETKKQKEIQTRNKEDFSWIELSRNTFTTITSIINNTNSDKTTLEKNTEAIKEKKQHLKES